ncbi:MAG: isoprenylcysteine carboxylmethyltransferase family protein [Lachnospiraceae bacterium]|nr:isoprenylcysteine carboxylmethyltransferase family protein [Lachnospiraceae bacterium]
MRRTQLIISALSKYIAGFLMVGLMLFLPAGTWNYFNGWLFVGLLFIPMFLLGVVLLVKSPELLEKRLRNKESESDQKKVVGASLVMFLAGFIFSALDFRFGWTNVPMPVVIAASVILLVSYGLYAEVMRENVYLSRTVEIQKEQKVIDTGLYGVVRHPMYFSTVLLFLSIPVVLGSWIGFAIFCIYPFLLVKRIKNEEMVLEEGLAGYKEYKEKVRYRMIPFVW